MSFRSRFEHLEGRRPEREDPRPGPTQNDRFAGLGEAPAVALPDDGGSVEVEELLAQPGIRADGTVDRPAAPAPTGRTARFTGVTGGTIPEEPAAPLAAEPPPDRIASSVPAWRGEAMPPDVAAEIRRKLGLPEPDPNQPQRREDALGWADRMFEQERMERGLFWFFAARRFGQYAVVVIALAVLLGSLLVRGCAAAIGR